MAHSNVKETKKTSYDLDEANFPLLYKGCYFSKIDAYNKKQKVFIVYNEVNQTINITNMGLLKQEIETRRSYQLSDLKDIIEIEPCESKKKKNKNAAFIVQFIEGNMKLKAKSKKKRNHWLNEMRLLKRNVIAFLTGTQKVKEIFDNYSLEVTETENEMTFSDFYHFLNDSQKIEILKEDAYKILNCETITYSDFLNYFKSKYGEIVNYIHKDQLQSMTQPLRDYFINSSHNTYLLNDQLFGQSSVDAYIYALNSGCRCVEIDVWNGQNNEPIVYHGYTKTSKIFFKDVIETLKQHAFLKSPYPLIISLENHTSFEQQEVVATYLDEILGNALFKDESINDLPSPEQLMYKFILKGNSGNVSRANGYSYSQTVDTNLAEYYEDDQDDFVEEEKDTSIKTSSTELNSIKVKEKSKRRSSKLGRLIVMCRSTKYKSILYSAEHFTSLDMFSIGESIVQELYKTEGNALVKHTQFQLVRTFPKGSRIGSSNYNPVIAWSTGCQMVALNVQTPTLPMHLNQGLFQLNGATGYVLKPDLLRNPGTLFNPSDISTRSVNIRLTIRIICGLQLYTRTPTEKGQTLERYVSIQMIGPPKFNIYKIKTGVVKDNGFNPNWDETMSFDIPVPELTHMRVYVKDKTEHTKSCGKLQDVEDSFDKVNEIVAKKGHESLIGQFCCPVYAIGMGYRFVPLMDDAGRKLTNTKLFVHISSKVLLTFE